jgi:prephenate dehydrogenase
MNIGIIGAGLMGGSLFKALKGAELLGMDWLERIEAFDLIILAVPISATLEIGAKIKTRRPLLVLDIGSVKEPIAQKFEEWTEGEVEFVASHPMAGKEKSGFDASDPALFQNAAWVITPHRKNTERALQIIEDLIRKTGATPMRMDAAEHDRNAALVSQLPYLLSKALFDFVDPEARKMAGPGFHSMVRLAQDNPELRKEIGFYNRENIRHFLKGYMASLENLL